MSKLRAVLMEVEVKTTRSVQPLIDFLKTNPQMTELLRDFLIELLELNGKFKLKFVAPRGKPISKIISDRRLAVYRRFKELTGTIATSISCAEIAKSVGGVCRAESKGDKTFYRITDEAISGFRLGKYNTEDSTQKTFRFAKDRAIPETAARWLVAIQFNYSVKGVEKIVNPIEAERCYDVPVGVPWIPKGKDLPVQSSPNNRIKLASAKRRR